LRYEKWKHHNPDNPEKYSKQFATKSQRHKDIILFFLRAFVSWWQDEKSFAIKNTKITFKDQSKWEEKHNERNQHG